MIKNFNAFIACSTVFRLLLDIYFANIAITVSEIKFLKLLFLMKSAYKPNNVRGLLCSLENCFFLGTILDHLFFWVSIRCKKLGYHIAK